MIYNEIFTDEFLNKFGKYKNEISKLTLEEDMFKIDVKAIAEICRISIKYNLVKPLGFSLQKDINTGDIKNEISVNQFESEYRQRYTIAHELGHILLGHNDVSYIFSDMSKYKNTIDRMNEVTANKFAAELIMPEKLVKKVILHLIKELNYSIDQKFDESDINQLLDISANKMGVPIQVFEYRIKSLDVFIEKAETNEFKEENIKI